MTISGAALIFINIGIIGYGQDKVMMTARFFCLISLQTRNTAQKDSRLFSFRIITEISFLKVTIMLSVKLKNNIPTRQVESSIRQSFKQDDTFVDTRYLKMNIF